ncbi:MAG: hypothetical protein KatS3mg110_1717 [Pirellulaceae bacterium]|nr:MAG: hypothetical protein KatS3mg110_1717 [Pirellulaceae bacterium]
MRVVVMLAVYNQAHTLPECLESLQAQTGTAWQLCALDDASTDGSGSLLQQWVERHGGIFFRNTKRLGLAASLNRIWREVPAELYARMDGDDICLPERLRRQVEYLERHPEVAVLGGAAEIMDADGNTLGILERPAEHEQLVRVRFRENPFVHPTVMMRRRFLEEMGGYDEGLPRGQDYDLWLRGINRFRYANLSSPLLRYRCNSRPGWKAIYWGTVVLIRAARRERLGWQAYGYAARYAIGAVLMRMGWRSHRWKAVPAGNSDRLAPAA